MVSLNDPEEEMTAFTTSALYFRTFLYRTFYSSRCYTETLNLAQKRSLVVGSNTDNEGGTCLFFPPPDVQLTNIIINSGLG